MSSINLAGRAARNRCSPTRTSARTYERMQAIMVAVFGLFATLSLIQMQQLGFGLAVAILIAATIVRAVLLPSTMRLLGEWNWYLPRWLTWLPSLALELNGRRRLRRPTAVPH